MKMNMNNNFFRMVLNKKWKKVFLVFVLLILCVVITYTFSVNVVYDHEIPSVEITSNDWSENESERAGGSWHIDKSAEWTGYNEAQIKFKLDTTPKYTTDEIRNFDVILTLDVSTSMEGEKIEKLKSSANKYIDYILKDSNNRVAIVEYHTNGSVLSNFSNNKSSLHNVVNNLSLKCSDTAGWCTNYYAGLVKTGEILNNYIPNNNRQLLVLFLTDGQANRDNSLLKGESETLKEKFPKMLIAGIQYEMGSEINYWLKQISDIQLDAYVDDIYDKFFEATLISQKEYLEKYDKFEIIDYMTKDFYVNSVDDIKVSKGKVKLSEENGFQKIVWTISDVDIDSDFFSGSSAQMVINATYVGQTKTLGFYPTNEKEVIKNKLENDLKEEIDESPKTPVLQNLYSVNYDPNLPSDCNNSYLIETKLHPVYQTVSKSNGDLICDGYIFKGWEYDESTDDFEKISDDKFIMPKHDVVIKAVWGTLNITKKMEGTVFIKRDLLYDIVKKGAASDKNINFNLYSSDTNGKGNYLYESTQYDNYPIYYYRGEVTNNNIIFANFCWKIVRTTETGGTKLIYNGKASSKNTCNNSVYSTYITTTSFNSSDSEEKKYGYMYDSTTSSNIKLVLEQWYKSNIQDKGYSQYLEDTIWCVDRNGSKSVVKPPVTTPYIYTGFGIRSKLNGEKPSITCSLKADSYTTKTGNNSKGNKLLTYPIALLTGDEAQLAGFAWIENNKVGTSFTYNTKSYLYTGADYWLLSPFQFISNSFVSTVSSKGSLNAAIASTKYGVRPSISLSASTRIYSSGNTGELGSTSNPYIVYEE